MYVTCMSVGRKADPPLPELTVACRAATVRYPLMLRARVEDARVLLYQCARGVALAEAMAMVAAATPQSAVPKIGASCERSHGPAWRKK